jgi:hypothetical protein
MQPGRLRAIGDVADDRRRRPVGEREHDLGLGIVVIVIGHTRILTVRTSPVNRSSRSSAVGMSLAISTCSDSWPVFGPLPNWSGGVTKHASTIRDITTTITTRITVGE